MNGVIHKSGLSSGNGVQVNLFGVIWSSLKESFMPDAEACDFVKQGYLKEGSRFFNQIDGSFAIAINDQSKGQVYLVRDKLGTVPIYYSEYGSVFAWGCRIQDILCQDGFYKHVNEDVLHEYLVFRYVSGRNTLFRDIYELLPAHYLKIDINSGDMRENRYWEIPYTDRLSRSADGEGAIIDRIEDFLIRNVRRSLENTDSRYGIMSSGGVDSSIILGIAARHTRKHLATYFIGFEDYDSDRSHDARMVAEKCTATHSEFYINTREYAEGLIDAIRVHEEPLNHPGHVGRVLFNKYIEGKLDNLILGEGVDTMFCGSKVYPLLKYGFVLNPFRDMTRKVFSLVSPEVIPSSLRRYYCKIRDVFIMDPADYMIRSLAETDFNEADRILEKKNNMEYLDYYRDFVSGCTRDNALDKYLRLNQHPFMVEVLNSEAKFGMAYRINNHYPFLDVDLISLANHLPFRLRSRGLTGKYIIKRLAARYFPRSFIYKRKEGFGVPLKKYFLNPHGMGKYFDLLRDQRTRERGIYKEEEISRLVDRSQRGEISSESYESLLWTVVNLELWFRIFIDRKGV